MSQTSVSNGGIGVSPVARQRTPLLVVLSGPSGVGKTTVTKALLEHGWDGHVVVTATTRRPRANEIDGVHYHFKSIEQFQEMIRRGELLEYAEVHGNWYGVPATVVREQLARGRDVILTIDPQGAKTIRERTSGALFVFLAPDSLEDLVKRVKTRIGDTPEDRTLRLLNAEREMEEMTNYDYVIYNRDGQFTQTVEAMRAILLAEHSRTHPRQARV